MVLVDKFCFWFSARLASIMIGIITLIQCAVWFMVSIISLENLDDVRKALDMFLQNLSLKDTFLNHVATDPHPYIVALNIFISILIVSCVLMVIGAFKCEYKLLIPFLIMDIIYVISLTIQHVFLMINYKKKEDSSLGSLILYSNIGGFILLYLLYMWICVLSFLQMLKELQVDLVKQFVHSNTELRRHLLTIVRSNNNEKF